MDIKIKNTTKNDECLRFHNFKFHFRKIWHCVKKNCSAYNYYVKMNYVFRINTIIDIKDIAQDFFKDNILTKL